MDCNIIQDLMPLYADALASESSRRLIEEHTAVCPKCRSALREMCTPMEPEPVDETRRIIDALHAQKRRQRLRVIIPCIIVALVCILGWWIYMETHFYGERIVTVSTDESEILAEVPDLALTDEEKELAETILEIEGIRDALSLDPYSYIAFEIDDIQEHIAPILPDGAAVSAVGVMAATVHIDYRVGDMRTILEYTDADLTGHVDVIRKYMADSPREYIAGKEFTGDVDEVFMLTYAVGSGITQYEKSEAKHMWFSFLDMP